MTTVDWLVGLAVIGVALGSAKLVVDVLPNIGTKVCPHCAERVKSAASKCKHCHERLG